jgi:DNA-binding transcriptional ArsR family regulator
MWALDRRFQAMSAIPDLATVAALIADPSRAAMLSALLGGVALPAGELAHRARISPQTASAHLARLVAGGLLSVTTAGRHHYFRLSNAHVAQALESIALIAPARPVRSLNEGLEVKAVRRARTCYDHLAGALGVALTQALIDQGLLIQHDEAFEVSGAGERWLHTFGVDCLQSRRTRRVFAAACLDWSERKPHLAGALGAAIAGRLFELKWIKRLDGSRAVTLTESGRSGLKRVIGIEAA